MKIVKARIVSYDKKLGDFARRSGIIEFHEDGSKSHVDSITMPQGWKIGATLDVTMQDGEIASIKVSRDQEIDRTQEGLL